MSLRNQYPRASLKRFFKRFRRCEDGGITIEAVLMVPLLFWSMFASFTFFDGYRQSGRNLKAAYALADVVSRERSEVNTAYFTNLHAVFENMVSQRTDSSIRITYLIYQQTGDQLDLEWSCVRGAVYQGKEWSQANIQGMKASLPVMPDKGRMIVVETTNTYIRPFKLGFGADFFQMDNIVFTHPRVFDQIVVDPLASNCNIELG
ncbi:MULTISPECIES: TadE/TadG family type IV pilus assembly protein [unclassified Ruegeria]|uniref:TadE/TadG family type IV pilus assembly protein n=1 Tax=unclassified Ruegeria TaxID=2625375 RepID=UPI001489E9C4|nr:MULTISPECIES: hypothetical protein [unclassified Ruegeria]